MEGERAFDRGARDRELVGIYVIAVETLLQRRCCRDIVVETLL